MLSKLRITLGLFLCLLSLAPRAWAETPAPPLEIERPLRLAPGEGNPRNSEGDFIRLKDGRLMLVYTRFSGGRGDHAAADLVGRYSHDGGRTWTDEDVVVVANEGQMNVMSVSLLRLQSGAVALFYLQKNSLTDCRPVMRLSTDEAQTWSDPVTCIDQVGYYVLNNDRAVQLRGGRLILPVALHNQPGDKAPDWAGRIMCWYSDDEGRKWQRSESVLTAHDAAGRRVTVQEPGVVELKDESLLMFCRASAGSQYVAQSKDGGVTFSQLGPSNIISPLSPASVERIPTTGDLLLVWNDHRDVSPQHRGKRTPLRAAISRDEGKTWENVRTLEDDPDGWYCYTAIDFVDGHVLLAHCAGNRSKDGGLSVTQVTRFPIEKLYE